jgi:hypothetical protein
MLASFGFFGHRSWIQLLVLAAVFHSSVTIKNLRKIQYKRFNVLSKKSTFFGILCQKLD